MTPQRGHTAGVPASAQSTSGQRSRRKQNKDEPLPRQAGCMTKGHCWPQALEADTVSAPAPAYSKKARGGARWGGRPARGAWAAAPR